MRRNTMPNPPPSSSSSAHSSQPVDSAVNSSAAASLPAQHRTTTLEANDDVKLNEFVEAYIADSNKNPPFPCPQPQHTKYVKWAAKATLIIGVALLVISSLTAADVHHSPTMHVSEDASPQNFMGGMVRFGGMARHNAPYKRHYESDGGHANGVNQRQIQAQQRRMLSRTASCTLHSASGSFQESVNVVRSLVNRSGGYVTQESTQSTAVHTFNEVMHHNFREDEERAGEWAEAVQSYVASEGRREEMDKTAGGGRGAGGGGFKKVMGHLRRVFPYHQQGSGFIVAKIPSSELDAFLSSLTAASRPEYTVHDIQRKSHEIPASEFTNTATLLGIAKSELVQFQSLYDALTTAREKMDLLPQLMEKEREVRRIERQKVLMEKSVEFATVTITINEAPLNIVAMLPPILARVWRRFHARTTLWDIVWTWCFGERPNYLVWVGDAIVVLSSVRLLLGVVRIFRRASVVV